MAKKIKILISGGGTGGHIFPAIAIADEFRKRFPEAEFLFIGANAKMEMQKIPQAGYKIVGLNIAGFNRGNLWKNWALPGKILGSLAKSFKIIKEFKPDFAIGTGGFASGPALYAAAILDVPIFIQEQNSLPGKTNKFLAKKAKTVFTAYPAMDQFFEGTKTMFLGNPVRKNILEGLIVKEEVKQKLGLDSHKLTILSVGGSLGSKTLNNALKENLDKILENDYQLIWQTGKSEYRDILAETESKSHRNLQVVEFIEKMDVAYSAADVIVSRAGAIAISELALAQKPVVLVPFPYAAEDHQTNNAAMLVDKNAARMVKDVDMKQDFWNILTEICQSEDLRREMSENIALFAKPNATQEIVDEIVNSLNIQSR